ncbi:hypothetical protein F9C07_2137103 [Aspergillus flavus]|uniref:Secreted protein n=1 Tax=Aspergillus flavus (strain ATCC 200026 / FGSC A1120 / IAM 13836 / NRRL 3357 / JCM 12722 / SRRC 167) TaxID=332952 RepID=A0A7U2QWW9_ASPFN|nr:hypothetical protein F9C07_2137103 [Aspergillus flavus]
MDLWILCILRLLVWSFWLAFSLGRSVECQGYSFGVCYVVSGRGLLLRSITTYHMAIRDTVNWISKSKIRYH